MHRYLLIAMLVNFGAAIGFYIHNTFRHPPPLTSEAANQATSGSRAPPQPPSSLQLSSCFRMRSLKARSGKFRPPTTPDGSPVPEAAAASDTTAVLDQASAPPPAGSEGGAGELCQPEDASGSQAGPKPKPTLANVCTPCHSRSAAWATLSRPRFVAMSGRTKTSGVCRDATGWGGQACARSAVLYQTLV